MSGVKYEKCREGESGKSSGALWNGKNVSNEWTRSQGYEAGREECGGGQTRPCFWAGPLPCRFPADFRPLPHSHAEWGSAIWWCEAKERKVPLNIHSGALCTKREGTAITLEGMKEIWARIYLKCYFSHLFTLCICCSSICASASIEFLACFSSCNEIQEKRKYSEKMKEESIFSVCLRRWRVFYWMIIYLDLKV